MRVAFLAFLRTVAGTALAVLAWPAAAGGSAQSLFDEASYRPLVAEDKARRIGDVLTVVVQESSSASSTADLRGQRSVAASAQLQLTGIPDRGNGPHAVTASTANDSSGAGRTQRSGRLLAQLSVRVLEVLANGDLLVSGQQSLKINGEEQLITLSGIVRPRDIADGNSVLSSRLASARIEFDGEGFVTDQSKPGLLARLLNLLGL
jgi:flagellar L-ring protein precursor FlgH